MQIIVLGMHRAGTSLTTRIINMMGAYFAPEGLSLGYNEHNEKGFWERKDVLSINEQLLRHAGATWHKVDGWDTQQLSRTPRALTHAIRSTILEMDAHRPWVLKDPRLCITLPCWLPHLEVPVTVLAARNPLASARSLELRNGIPPEYGIAMWEYHAVHSLRNTLYIPKIHVRYETMLDTPIDSVRTLYDELCARGVQGLRMPSEREIMAFIDSDLQRASPTQVNYRLTPNQERLFAMQCGEIPFEPDMEVSPQSRHVMETTVLKSPARPPA